MIADTDELNAFAAPGGVVVINSGLIEVTMRPEQLAGVLAHEIQHVELRHSLDALVKQTGMFAAWAMLTGDIGFGNMLLLEIFSLNFSRQAENEADLTAYEVLKSNKIDPRGMLELFEILNTDHGDKSSLEWLSTHPDSDARVKVIEKLIDEDKLVTKGFLPIEVGTSWPP